MLRLGWSLLALWLVAGCDSGTGEAPTSQDRQGPTLAFLSPGAGATLRGTVPVTYSATDASGVASVVLILDGQDAGQGADGTVQLNTRLYAEGTHTLALRATDRVGNVGRSPIPLSVTFENVQADTTPPQVRIQSPTVNARLRDDVEVRYTATDDSGVASVELLVNGQFVVEGRNGVAAFDSGVFADGSATLALRATDTAGNVGLSASVMVTFANTARRAVLSGVSVLSYPDGNWGEANPPELYVTVAGVRTVGAPSIGQDELPIFLDLSPDLALNVGTGYGFTLWDEDFLDDDLMVAFPTLDLRLYARDRPSQILLLGPGGTLRLNVLRWEF